MYQTQELQTPNKVPQQTIATNQKHLSPHNFILFTIRPFFVVKKTTDSNYLLATSFDDKSFRAHISQLKPFVARTPRPESSEPGGSVMIVIN